MTCIIQETQNRRYLASDGNWTSDFNQAHEFSTIRETMAHKEAMHLDDAAILVFRGKLIYRLEKYALVPLSPALAAEEWDGLRPAENS